jgi:hypothetical protein
LDAISRFIAPNLGGDAAISGVGTNQMHRHQIGIGAWRLPAILFHLAFWHMDLGYFGRGLLGSWPHADIGVVLWSLSVSAGDWQTSEKLTRLCTIPEPAILSGPWDRTPHAMEARILRPLLWFGLLEYRSEKIQDARFGARHYYRKAPLFDRLLAFDVKMDFAGVPRH